MLQRKPLTHRQIQILKGLDDFRSNKEIGRDLNISDETVKSHKKLIANKWGTPAKNGALIKMGRELGYLAIFMGFLALAPTQRIAPKSAPKRHTTEQVVRRALPKYDIEQYQAA